MTHFIRKIRKNIFYYGMFWLFICSLNRGIPSRIMALLLAHCAIYQHVIFTIYIIALVVSFLDAVKNYVFHLMRHTLFQRDFNKFFNVQLHRVQIWQRTIVFVKSQRQLGATEYDGFYTVHFLHFLYLLNKCRLR